MPDVMLDMETLATSPDAVILTFGAVKFDPFSSKPPSDPLYLRLDVIEQTELGRQVNDDTIAWWANQPEDIREEALSEEDRVALADFAAQLNRYVVGANKIWAQGPTFDICMIENLFRMLGIPVNWQYWQIRDSRTLFDLGDDSAKKNNTGAHNALADAYCQAEAVQNIYNELGIKKK
jgi:hypothetical protein